MVMSVEGRKEGRRGGCVDAFKEGSKEQEEETEVVNVVWRFYILDSIHNTQQRRNMREVRSVLWKSVQYPSI